MPSYVITGVSKGLGWEFMNQLSADPNNTVVGIIRNLPPTAERVSKELSDRKNITLLQADLTKYTDVKRAASEASEILGGKLDYLFANAGYVTVWDAYDNIGVLGKDPEGMDREFYKVMDINVLANIHLYNLFMPLILKGDAKKVVNISSAQGDMEWAKKYNIGVAAIYSTSKAAMNMIVAKYSVQYKKDGVCFLAICPGMVDVGHFDQATPEQMQGLGTMLENFKDYAPNFKGPDTPHDSIKAVLKVVYDATVEKNSGDYLSHFGNKQWL